MTCPTDDSCTYMANGTQFGVQCDTDFAGGDLSSSDRATFNECVGNCAGTSGCAAVSYQGVGCYLKGNGTRGVQSGGVIGE